MHFGFTKLRVLALCAAATLVLQATAGQADVITFDPDGAGGAGAIAIDAIDWAPGNSLAKGGNAAVQAFQNSGGQVQTPFDLFFQASLANLMLNNQSVTPANLGPGGANELTVVAAFTEVVTGVFPSGPTSTTAVFGFADVQRVNYFEIYWDPTRDSDDLAGTGFNSYPGDSDAILILSGSVVDAGGNFTAFPNSISNLDNHTTNGDNYPLIDTVRGFGGASVTVEVDFADPNFFQLDPGLFIQLVLTGTLQELPFDSVDPSGQFLSTSTTTAEGVTPTPDGAGGGTLGTINGLNGVDIQFQTDAESTFTVIPEPTSLTLLGLGAFGFGLAGIRRRRSVDTQA